MNKYKKIIYLDMDGVLADFNAYVLEKIGRTLDSFPNSQAGWDAMKPYLKGLYYNLKPMPDAKDLVNGVFEIANIFGYGVGVLTAMPKYNRVPNAKDDKIDWLNFYFPNLLTNFNIGPWAEHKQYHCRPGDVLIDDSKLNIPQWIKAGGIGIFHTSAESSLKELYTHLKNKG